MCWRWRSEYRTVTVPSPDEPVSLDSLERRARGHYEAGDFQAAIKLFDQVLIRLEDKTDPAHPRFLANRNDLARACRYAGWFDRALSLYRQILDIQIRKLGPDHPDALRSLSRIANTYYAAGRYEEAIRWPSAKTRWDGITRIRYVAEAAWPTATTPSLLTNGLLIYMKQFSRPVAEFLVWIMRGLWLAKPG